MSDGILLFIAGRAQITDGQEKKSCFSAGDTIPVNKNSFREIGIEGAEVLQFLYLLLKNSDA